MALAIPFVKESRAHGDTSYDIPGAITATLGLVTLVYGITKAGTNGWTDPVTLTFFAVALALLAAFVVIESRTRNPLLPLRVVEDRNRGGSFLGMFLTAGGLFAMFLLLSYYFQGVLGYSALKSGFAFLPFSVGIIISAGLASQMLPRFGPRPLAFGGLVSATLGMLWLTQLDTTPQFVTHVLPAVTLMSLGLGFVFVSLSATALFGVSPHDAGVASGLLNTAQQIGGSLGIAVMNTIAASATASYIAGKWSCGCSRPASCTASRWHSRCLPGSLASAAIVCCSSSTPTVTRWPSTTWESRRGISQRLTRSSSCIRASSVLVRLGAHGSCDER